MKLASNKRYFPTLEILLAGALATNIVFLFVWILETKGHHLFYGYLMASGILFSTIVIFTDKKRFDDPSKRKKTKKNTINYELDYFFSADAEGEDFFDGDEESYWVEPIVADQRQVRITPREWEKIWGRLSNIRFPKFNLINQLDEVAVEAKAKKKPDLISMEENSFAAKLARVNAKPKDQKASPHIVTIDKQVLSVRLNILKTRRDKFIARKSNTVRAVIEKSRVELEKQKNISWRSQLAKSSTPKAKELPIEAKSLKTQNNPKQPKLINASLKSEHEKILEKQEALKKKMSFYSDYQ